MFIDVNSDAVVLYSAKLGRLHKSAFPNAVRTALNSAAFDVKQKTMLASSEKAFDHRQRNFFRANSRVNMAQGWDVNNMESQVGFVSLSGTNFAVDDLDQQEHGGLIKKKSFIPLDKARTGKNYKRGVSRKNRLGSMRNIVVADKAQGASKGERFVKSIIHAGAKGLVLSEDGILWRVNSLKRTRDGAFKLTAIYSFKKGRNIRVKATHFMQKASEKSAKKLNDFYIIEAEKQFQKALR